jgi:hypothetical protein
MCTCVIQSRRRRVCLAAPKRAILTLKNLLALLFQSPARAADLCSAHTRSFKTCAWDDAGLAPHPPPLSLSSSLACSPFCLSSALGPPPPISLLPPHPHAQPWLLLPCPPRPPLSIPPTTRLRRHPLAPVPAVPTHTRTPPSTPIQTTTTTIIITTPIPSI